VADDAAFIWDRPTRQRPARRDRSGDQSAESSTRGRITLREAERRFGVRTSTLRTWARRGKIDGIKHSEQWYVTPESVGHHLSRSSPRATPTERPAATGPTEDGTAMLVPRDAWDRLMDQLGNLHEAGLNLAEARERAAKAETEAAFLRDRLAEMRSERDELKELIGPPRPRDLPQKSSPSVWEGFRRRYGWLWGRRDQG
jgi:DNA-binding transcriptional MerR regulator